MTSGITAVLPVRGAAANLEGSILELAAVLDGLVGNAFDLVLIDAGACAYSAEALDRLISRLPLRVIAAEPPLSDADAMRLGCAAAERDLILFTTCDGQFDPRQLNALLEAIDAGDDVAVGYRAARADGPWRRLEGWGWNALVNMALGPTGRDVDCAFKIFRRDVWLAVRPRSSGPTLGAELLAKARRLGFRVSELPVRHYAARACPAPGPGDMLRGVGDLISLRRQMQRIVGCSDAAVRVSGRAA